MPPHEVLLERKDIRGDGFTATDAKDRVILHYCEEDVGKQTPDFEEKPSNAVTLDGDFS